MAVAVVEPTLLEQLTEKLKNGEVSFTFTKKDGTERKARGTKKMDIIPSEATPKGTGVERSNIVTYYDLDKSAWRSFNSNSLVSIDA